MKIFIFLLLLTSNVYAVDNFVHKGLKPDVNMHDLVYRPTEQDKKDEKYPDQARRRRREEWAKKEQEIIEKVRTGKLNPKPLEQKWKRFKQFF